MSDKGLTRENLLFIYPKALREDLSLMALGSVSAEALAARSAEIGQILIYPAIDTLDEGLLDILAYDFKVDWWDPEYSLEEKRRTMKESWYVHKRLGTAGAVKRAIRAIYPDTAVEPWFKYEGGKPYHFRLKINITGDSGDRERQRRLLERIDFYKSLRDRVDEVRYVLMPQKAHAVAGGAFLGARREIRTAVSVPALKPPGGRAGAGAYGGLRGSVGRLAVAVGGAQRARPPAGQGGAVCGARVLGVVQRVAVAVRGGPTMGSGSE